MEWKGFLVGLIVIILAFIGVWYFFGDNPVDLKKIGGLQILEQDCKLNPNVCFECYNESGGLRLSSTPIKDSNYCKIQCLSNPDSCYIKLALGAKTPLYCNKIPYEGKGYDQRSLCYFKLATQEKNLTICNFITSVSNSEGYIAYKQSCINAVNQG